MQPVIALFYCAEILVLYMSDAVVSLWVPLISVEVEEKNGFRMSLVEQYFNNSVHNHTTAMCGVNL